MSKAPTIAVLARHRGVGSRIARVAAGASSGARVIADTDMSSLVPRLGEAPVLLMLDEADLDAGLELLDGRYPDTRIAVWTSDDTAPLIARAHEQRRIVSVIGWPGFRSMPRPWELAYAVRRTVTPQVKPPHINDLLLWGASSVRFRPTSTGEMDQVLSKVGVFAERLGIAPRVVERVGECAHELLMNAIYDAPVDADGHVKYADNRRQNVQLDQDDAPTMRLASDGQMVGLEINDPFGRLEKHHVTEGILRGLRGASGEQNVLDTSRGGAGLGMVRLYTHAAMLLFDVRPGRQTRVIWLHELDVSARDFRSLPTSLHFFGGQP